MLVQVVEELVHVARAGGIAVPLLGVVLEQVQVVELLALLLLSAVGRAAATHLADLVAVLRQVCSQLAVEVAALQVGTALLAEGDARLAGHRAVVVDGRVQ